MHFVTKFTSLLAVVSLVGNALAKPVQLNRRDDIVIGVRHMSQVRRVIPRALR